MTLREQWVGDTFVADKVATEAKHPSMSDVKSLPGYREHADGTWSAPAKGAWGEAMRPYWRADMARHQGNLGNGAYEPKQRLRGKTKLVAREGKLYRVTDGQLVEVV